MLNTIACPENKIVNNYNKNDFYTRFASPYRIIFMCMDSPYSCFVSSLNYHFIYCGNIDCYCTKNNGDF